MLFRIALSMKNKATFPIRYLYVQYILNMNHRLMMYFSSVIFPATNEW